MTVYELKEYLDIFDPKTQVMVEDVMTNGLVVRGITKVTAQSFNDTRTDKTYGVVVLGVEK